MERVPVGTAFKKIDFEVSVFQEFPNIFSSRENQALGRVVFIVIRKKEEIFIFA